MGSSRPFLTHLLTLTGVAALSLFNSAFASADELTDLAARAGLPADFFSAPEDNEDGVDAPLPRMKLQDEAELKRMYDERRYSFDTPRQKSSERPLIDWERIEPGLYGGFVHYSSGFRADLDYVAGISLRLPIPGIPGHWAAFAEGFAGHINRNLAFFYNNQAGTWYGATVGGDYTLYEGSISYFRVRGGILYADFNNIQHLKNGVGGLVGAELGFFWVQHTDRFRLTFTPEYTFDGTDSMMLLTVGLSFYF